MDAHDELQKEINSINRDVNIETVKGIFASLFKFIFIVSFVIFLIAFFAILFTFGWQWLIPANGITAAGLYLLPLTISGVFYVMYKLAITTKK